MSVFLRLKNITRNYLKNNEIFTAVSELNLEVTTGEFLTFLGPSGCGKTTTLRMVAGFESPSSGTIELDGKDITDLPANKRQMGFVFQNYALFPHMKIFDNVAYGLRIQNESADRIKLRVREALAMVGLEKLMNNYPNQLSGGEQQRVALARVLVLHPKIILMDEPLSNLDAKLRIHMRTEIRRIQKEMELTCLYVTHDQKEALTMSDRIMVMNKGRIEQIGHPMELYDDPSSPFVADFIGQANLFKGTLASNDGEYGLIKIGEKKLKARLSKNNPPKIGENAFLIVRPECINFEPSENFLPGYIENCLFEGDRVNYGIRLTKNYMEEEKNFSAAIPFTPGMEMQNVQSEIHASFLPQSGVIIKSE